MLNKKSNIYNLVLIVITLLITIAVYGKLPNEMPIHWNASGEVDGYGPKLLGAFLLPMIMIFTWIGMVFLPKIDPKKDNYKKFSSSYSIVISLLITFFFIIHLTVLGTVLGYNISINKVIPFIVGILFIVMGNYLPKAKSNFFYGIKTPWTLTSEYSWQQTHRLGGKLFVLAGVMIMIASFFFQGNAQFAILITSVLTSALVPIVASYFYAQKDKK